jgi:hypothetical protein
MTAKNEAYLGLFLALDMSAGEAEEELGKRQWNKD